MKKLFTVLFSVLVLSTTAQLFDTTVVGIIQGNASNYYDTTLSISSYLNFNDYSRDNFGLISMGNQGDIRRRLIPTSEYSLQPNLGIDGYFKNYKSAVDLPYLNVYVPSGGIRFLLGYTKGQMFGLDFTINPISRLNIYIDFQRINSRGRYFNQENKSDQLNLTTAYFNKKSTYFVNGAVSFNNANNIEFGGITDTAAFSDNTTGNRELIPVNLLYSTSKARYLDILLQQQYVILKFMKREMRGFYDFNYSFRWQQFASGDSVFTTNALFDEAPIRDSIHFSQANNAAGILWIMKSDSTSKENRIKVGARIYSTRYGNDYLSIAENNSSIFGDFNFKFSKSLRLTADAEMFFTNDFVGTFSANGLFVYSLNDEVSISGNASFSTVRPGYFYQRYISNNFYWDLDLENINSLKLGGAIQYNGFNLSVNNSTLQNYVYLDQQVMTSQYTETINLTEIDLKGNISLGAHFYLDNRIRYQVTNATNVIRVPNWILREVVYYERDIFKRAARLQTGIEFNYFSSFKSEAYMPALGMMYLQDDISIGNFPYFNFLFNFRIQEFTFFLRLENITQGLFKYNYYAAPYYPLPDFAFRIGATWRFFN